MAAQVLCILAAIEPQMYRQVLAFHFCQERPQADVVLASSGTLQDEARRMRPIWSSPVRSHRRSRKRASSGWK